MTHEDFYFVVMGPCIESMERPDSWHSAPILNLYEREETWKSHALKALGPSLLRGRKTVVKGLKNAYGLVRFWMTDHMDLFKNEMRETLECIPSPLEADFYTMVARFPQFFAERVWPTTVKGILVDILHNHQNVPKETNYNAL
jgi:hypothetical protein